MGSSQDQGLLATQQQLDFALLGLLIQEMTVYYKSCQWQDIDLGADKTITGKNKHELR